jgi:lipopolysaccharide transport system permease protein
MLSRLRFLSHNHGSPILRTFTKPAQITQKQMEDSGTSFHRVHLRLNLWWQFTVRAVEMKHRGSYLGFLWAVLNPLLMAGLYVSVLGYVFNGRFHARPDETSVDYALGVFLGLLLFHLLTEIMSGSPALIWGQPNLVKKVVFPLEILPLAQLGAVWFHATIGLLLFLGFEMTLGQGTSLTGLLLVPVVLLPFLLLTVGTAFLFSALGVFFRDISQLIPFTSQALLWASAIFFSPTVIEKSTLGWSILKWNPLMHTIDQTRNVLLWDQPINWQRLAYTYAIGAVICLIGLTFFRATKRSFAEVI